LARLGEMAARRLLRRRGGNSRYKCHT
jgi:hypothetical protein